MQYRSALPTDLKSIVSVHVKESQQAYGHILPEAYLRDVMPGEKWGLWRARLEGGLDSSKLSVTVAEHEGDLAGFACFQFDHETDFGTYLHNIYVARSYQRQGVGCALLIAGIASLGGEQRRRPVHLRVFAENDNARAFYQRLGGQVTERMATPQYGNGLIEQCRYQWLSANQLKRNATSERDGRFQKTIG